ncbi:hypothetical protein ACIPSK_03860 [Rhizobium sp. LARHSG275]|uniref:hypothetical protein n=1 Tax=Rhizobium TaxID=379 RepID=UPI00138A19FA|nr:hypothetical protein [Rhizobium laguerreae]NDK49087.1 hypothetical protein [Rhizobium laguerreae]
MDNNYMGSRSLSKESHSPGRLPIWSSRRERRSSPVDDEFAEVVAFSKGTEAAGTRVDIAFALGIVGSGARKALKVIAEIQNKFAHKLEIHSFDHPDVTKLIDKLKYIDFAITGPGAEGLMRLWNRSPNSEVTSGSGWRASDNPFDHRGKFEKTCGFLQHSLRTSVPGSTHPDLHEK